MIECNFTAHSTPIDESAAMDQAFRFLRQAQMVYVIGNGGSAGIASHFSNDLMKALKIPSQTLFDSNLLTCLANDYGYDQIFSYPLECYLKSNDLLVAISSSGKSPSILNAVSVARKLKTPIITLSGFSPDNPLRSQGDLNFHIDRHHYGLVEMAHFCILHTIIDAWNTTNITPVEEYAKTSR